MEKYSASLFRLRPDRAGPFAAAFAATLLAGCAATSEPGEPSPTPVVADTAVEASSAARSERPVPELPLSLREDAPLRYTVKAGDTLWGIASRYLRDPWQWPELWYTNEQVQNPHRIRPGDVLTLISVDGSTRLAFDGPSERLAPRIREEALDSTLPAIPIEAIRNFLRGPRLVTAEETRRAPYIVAFVDERLAVGANSDVYVRNLGPDVAYNYAVIRVGEPYRDPDTRKLLGYEAIPTGEAELREPGNASGPTALMRVTKSSREVLIADRLLPIEAESFDANFYPHPPAMPVDGRIISVFDGLTQISQYQIVALNRGSDHGLDPGTVLDILQAGRTVVDPYAGGRVVLPDQYAGALMVFKVTPALSYALVMNATRAVHVLDKVARPAPSALR